MKNYKLTFLGACFCFFMQALVINVFPFYFTTFSDLYDITLRQLTFLTVLIFAVQFLIDAFGYRIADKIGYKNCIFLCNACVVIGFLSVILTIKFVKPFIAIIVAIVFSSFGGGLIETVTSPMVEALPFNSKSAKMSLLHSFYCWGHLLTVLGCTLFMVFIPKSKWYLSLLIWLIVPLASTLIFIKAPVEQLTADEESSGGTKLFKNKVFICALLAIAFAGAIEQGLAQWISYFTEKTLKMNKSTGDLLGTCAFALCMASSRTFYGILGNKLNLSVTLLVCSLCAFAGILCIPSNVTALSVIGIIVAGLSIGILWPGILSLTTKSNVNGGTRMFSFLALLGDAGCLTGPLVLGSLASSFGFKTGMTFNAVYGILIAVTVVLIVFFNKKRQTTNPASPKTDL